MSQATRNKGTRGAALVAALTTIDGTDAAATEAADTVQAALAFVTAAKGLAEAGFPLSGAVRALLLAYALDPQTIVIDAIDGESLVQYGEP